MDAFDKAAIAARNATQLGKPHKGSLRDPERTVLARYSYNIALCEALYPVLNVLEVSLRNAICRAMETRDPGTGGLGLDGRLDCWLDRADGVGLLTDKHRKMIREAKGEIVRDGRELSQGRLIAELKFGFWTGLFASQYGDPSPSQPKMWPSLFPTAFPHLDDSVWNRAKVADRLNRIRLLRNRAFHHEPVWSRKLRRDHDEIMEVIGWISHQARAYAESVSRLNAVVKSSMQPFESRIKDLVSALYPSHAAGATQTAPH